MRIQVSYVALGLTLAVSGARAQTQPATIPTVVALSMAIEEPMFGLPQFFDGRLPTHWPAALVPAQARVLGGGMMGDSTGLRFMSAVFAFSGQIKPAEIFIPLLTQAGYKLEVSGFTHRTSGGFVESEAPETAKYCNGASLASFKSMDSTSGRFVVTVMVIDGEGVRQECEPATKSDRPAMSDRGLPITVPALSPPKGATNIGGVGSSWSGRGGETAMTLRTTMPADSVLFHYTTQLVAGGWKAERSPGIAEGSAVQRFSFRQGSDDWVSALFVLATAGECEVVLRFTKK